MHVNSWLSLILLYACDLFSLEIFLYFSVGSPDVESRSAPNGFMLSHGRQYHLLRISSDDDKIEVKIYRPR